MVSILSVALTFGVRIEKVLLVTYKQNYLGIEVKNVGKSNLLSREREGISKIACWPQFLL